MFLQGKIVSQLFVSPAYIFVALLIGVLIGGGSIGLYLSYRIRHVLEVTNSSVQKHVVAWLVLGFTFLFIGAILLLSMLIGKIYLSGWSREILFFLLICLLVALIIALPIVVFARILDQHLKNQRTIDSR